MGTQKTTKLAPYSRGNQTKVQLQREALQRSAETARTERIIRLRHKQRVAMAQELRRPKDIFDWKAFNSRPVYIPQPGAPGFNHF